MRANRTIVAIIAAVITLANPASSARETNQSQLTIVGPVVAYETSLLRLIQLTFVLQTDVVIVRVDKLIKGREPARYVKVVYRYGSDEPSLIKEIFDNKKRWRFTLKRDPECDSSVGKMKAVNLESTEEKQENEEVILPALKFTSETEVLADDTNLPCYQLQPGGYRAEK